MTGEGMCPRKAGYVLVNVDTGEQVPARCGANFCTYCGPKNAWLVGLAIALAAPERFVRFSLVGDDWDTARNRMKRVTHRVRHDLQRDWNMAWHRERNPKGTGHHVHAYQHGDYIPQDVLQQLCEREGMGIPDIRRFEARGSVVYGMKSITYGMKGMQSEQAAREFLEWNGGRLVHASRGFWRDPVSGVLLTKRTAEKIALDRWNGERDAGEWIIRRRPAA